MSITLSEVYPHFLSDLEHVRQLRPATLRAYRYELAAASRDVRFAVPLQTLTRSVMESWLMRDSASPSTMQRRRATFATFFRWAVEQGYCDHLPLSTHSTQRVTRRLPRPVQDQQDRDRLEQAIRAARMPYRLILLLLRETGMRVSEVLDLRVGDVVLDAGREALRVREPKNSIERMVVLGPTATPHSLRGLRAHLKTLPQREPHALLFRSTRGTRVSYDALHYQWRKVCQQADLLDSSGKPRYTLHQLRHTRASELLAQGQPLEIVQRVLGHRDIRSTLGYADLHEGQVRAALERPTRR